MFANADRPHRRHGPVMGTMASIHVHDEVAPARADAAIDAVFAELERLEEMFSTFRATSIVSRVNRGELSLVDCPPEVIEVMDACTWLEHVSDGAFSARRPDRVGELDPAGFVKGWATEKASARLVDAGLEHWYVSVGGDLVVHGRPLPEERWQVAIADPLHPGDVIARLEIVSGAVATSGTAARGEHVWDGRSGHAANELAAITVVGPVLAWADAFATAAFAQGERGVTWVEQFDGYGAIAVHRDGTVVASNGIDHRR
jgi:FAD:protein FMN transferase